MHSYSTSESSERCQVVADRCVLSAHVKAFSDSFGARSAGSRLFQVVGPLTEKLRCPTAAWTRGTSLGSVLVHICMHCRPLNLHVIFFVRSDSAGAHNGHTSSVRRCSQSAVTARLLCARVADL